jgi:heavy metal response regulator
MRILVVEDEKRVGQFLKKGLQAEQFVVDVATDGERGLSLALSGSYDIIVLDMMLPRKDGIEVLRELRRGGIAVPVLVLSARADVEHRVAGLELGADDYLAKPFSFSEVLARVRSLMRRNTSAEPRNHLLSIADLKMDLLARKVSRAGKDIPLTGREFNLLEYLLRNRGRVLSRVILTEHIWDLNFDTETNIVDVAINRLRKKVDEGFGVPLIHTMRGVGYVLREEAGADDEQ